MLRGKKEHFENRFTMRTSKKLIIGLAVLAVSTTGIIGQHSELWPSTRDYAESMFVIVWYHDPPQGVVRPKNKFLPMHWATGQTPEGHWNYDTNGSLSPRTSTCLDSDKKLATEYGRELQGYKTNKAIGVSKESSLVFYIHPGRFNALNQNNLLKVELFPGRGYAIIQHKELRRIVPIQKYTRLGNKGYVKSSRTTINLGELK